MILCTRRDREPPSDQRFVGSSACGGCLRPQRSREYVENLHVSSSPVPYDRLLFRGARRGVRPYSSPAAATYPYDAIARGAYVLSYHCTVMLNPCEIARRESRSPRGSPSCNRAMGGTPAIRRPPASPTPGSAKRPFRRRPASTPGSFSENLTASPIQDGLSGASSSNGGGRCGAGKGWGIGARTLEEGLEMKMLRSAQGPARAGSGRGYAGPVIDTAARASVGRMRDEGGTGASDRG